jgi:hypothetical protein
MFDLPLRTVPMRKVEWNPARRNQVVNEVPQPQEDLAFGFSNLKPALVVVVT